MEPTHLSKTPAAFRKKRAAPRPCNNNSTVRKILRKAAITGRITLAGTDLPAIPEINGARYRSVKAPVTGPAISGYKDRAGNTSLAGPARSGSLHSPVQEPPAGPETPGARYPLPGRKGRTGTVLFWFADRVDRLSDRIRKKIERQFARLDDQREARVD